MDRIKTINRIFVALIVALGLALTGIAIGWGVTASRAQAEVQQQRAVIENGYKQQYYQLCYNVGNLSDYLNKLTVASSPTMQMQLLGQINGEAAAAGASLNALVSVDDDARKTTKYINQVGDYCLRLQYAIAEGGQLGERERDNLVALYAVVMQLEAGLDKVKEQVEAGDFDFLDSAGSSVFAETVASFEAEAVAYPALIYDGPFSDALDTAQPMGLTGDAITREQAAQKVALYLPTEYTLSYLGELGGKIPAYRFAAETASGTYYLDVTETGGHLLNMSADVSPADTVYTAEECRDYGAQYLAHIGITDMQAVWVSNYNSVYYINYAYTQEDVVCYSDLIVLKVDAETKTLVGVEARNYLMNHRARELSPATITAAEAKATVSKKVQIDGARVALIPTEGGGERLTYEVSGTTSDNRYFFYIDAHTGKECKILRVIDSAQGMLLQ
jgi:germination protein YpeB